MADPALAETCTCGHVRDEHHFGTNSECEIDGCDCICFDWDGEGE